MKFKTIAIIGAGTMGRSISRTASSAGIEVLWKDRNLTLVNNAVEVMANKIDKSIERWGLTPGEKKSILSRIVPVDGYGKMVGIELVIETIQEDFEAKVKLLTELEAVVSEQAILITNTSTLSVTEIASKLKHPERLIGIHFIYPVSRSLVVEIIRGLQTSTATFETTQKFIAEIGKTAIEVFEYPGYVTTRLLIPFINEALYIVMEGVASAADVDKAIKLGYHFPIGPLALADQMGLDEVMAWMEHLFKELGDTKYRPCPLLRKLVRAGKLGIKTGEGIFKYKDEYMEALTTERA